MDRTITLNANHFCKSYLASTTWKKQFLLEAAGLHQRAHRLNHLIQFILHKHQGIKGWD
jgi:uncharacterized protein